MLIKLNQDEQAQEISGNRPKAVIGFLLDGSVSMSAYKEETIRGYNWYLRDLKDSMDAKTHLKMRIFRDSWESRTIPAEITDGDLIYALPLNRLSYNCAGGTPLYDYIMAMITNLDAWVQVQAEPKPLVIIQTDGEDTSSQLESTYVRSQIRKRMAQGWEFVLIAMGINGNRLGAEVGIEPDSILDYKAGKIIQAFQSVAKLTKRSASGGGATFMLEDRRAQK